MKYICKFCGKIFVHTTNSEVKCPVCGEDYYLKKAEWFMKGNKNEDFVFRYGWCGS
jgi:rubrerythrin